MLFFWPLAVGCLSLSYLWEKAKHWMVAKIAEEKKADVQHVGKAVIVHYDNYAVILPFSEEKVFDSQQIVINGEQRILLQPGICLELVPEKLGALSAHKVTEEGDIIQLELNQPIPSSEGEIWLQFKEKILSPR